MHLSQTEIEKIAKSVIKQLLSAKIGVSDEGRARDILITVVHENMEEERRLEEDALKLLKKHQQAAGSSLDHNRALRMIKEKLAAERKFIL